MVKDFYNNSALMRVIDDKITPHNSRCATSTNELRTHTHTHRERERDIVGEIKRKQETKRKKPQPTEREREIGIFYMRFDSATSTFLALLVIKPYRKKTERCNI